MKKLFSGLLFLCLVIAPLTSCSDDDSVPQVEHFNIEDGILGVWYPKGGTLNGGDFMEYTGDSCEEFGDYQEFANGQLSFVGYDESCVVNETNSSAYTISGNILTVEGSNGLSNMAFTIISLTSLELILESTYNTPEGMVTERTHYGRS